MPPPIGISFMPNADNQALGPQQGALNGPGGDLSQAFKILSLRLPRVLGAGALAPPGLLRSPGAAGAPGGLNPHAAVFEALLKALVGGGSPGGFPGGTASDAPGPMGPPPMGGPISPLPLPRSPQIPQFTNPYQDVYQTPTAPFAQPGGPKITIGQNEPPNAATLPGGTATGTPLGDGRPEQYPDGRTRRGFI